MALLAAAAVFLTVFILALAISTPRPNAIRERVVSLATSRSSEPKERVLSFSERVLSPMVDGMTKKAVGILPQGLMTGLRGKLERAGAPLTLSGFLMVCGAAAGVLGGLGLAMAVSLNGAIDMKAFAMALVGAGVGVFLPFMWLSSRARQRQSAIIKTLPDAFDLITTCVEAGLGLDAALARVAEKVKGSFAEELSITLREIGMGRPHAEALHDLAERTAVPDLTMFVNAIIQAEQMGTSIGQVLRVQSEQMRMRRRQRAEETAAKAPVKMIFPLVLCILPTLFIVIMGPAVIELMDSFSKTS